MKTKTQTKDQQLALHNLQELRQRLTGAPAPNDKARASGADPSEPANGLVSATGFMGA